MYGGTGTYNAQYVASNRLIKLRQGSGGTKVSVLHEAGHDFFFEYRGYAYAAEKKGLNEGVASIFTAVGASYPIAEPAGQTLADSIANHSGDGAHHDAGRHLGKSFRRLADSIGENTAKDAFLNAVKNLADKDQDGEDDFTDFMAAVNAEVGTDQVQRVIDAFRPTGILTLPRILQHPDDLPPESERVPVAVPTVGPGLDLSQFTCYWNFREGAVVCISNRYPPPEEGGPPPTPVP